MFRPFQHALRSFEDFVKDVIYNKRQDRRARKWVRFFYLLSLPYYGIVYLRTKAYQKRWLRSQHLGCVVVVVGNLTVGGTGKTPIVEKLARALQGHGRKVSVLSRGYKSKKESLFKKFLHWLFHSEPCPPKIVSDGKQCLLSPEIAGDEPYLLAKNLPNISVVVDKDRVKAGRYAIQTFDSDTLILDDGFQYFQLRGTFYILLIDATNPFGNGSVLPRGILREPLQHMRRAHFIFITKSDQVAPERLQALQRFVRRYNPKAPLFPCVHSPKYLQEINGDQKLDLKQLRGVRIAVMSGIASPKSFEQFLEDAGAQIVYCEHFMDHHNYTEADIEEFFDRAKRFEADWVITTEKDAVRLEKFKQFELPFYYLRMEIEWASNTKPLECILQKLSSKLG